jgi:arginyl-tRNA synthetase
LKQELEQLLLAALARLVPATLAQTPPPSAVVIERTRDGKHGDFASNVALRLAKDARKSPRELAALVVAALPESPLIARTEVAGIRARAQRDPRARRALRRV